MRKTYPVELAVREIVAGFERRKRRICVPKFMVLGHALRPLLTTRIAERDALAVAPEMERAFKQELAERGLAASVSERTGGQVSHEGDRVHAASSASSGGG